MGRADPRPDDVDPLTPPLPEQTPADVVVRPPFESDPDMTDPVRELARYVTYHWFQQLFPMRTKCYRCHIDSPVVHIPVGGLAFGDPRIAVRLKKRNELDVTKEAIDAFGQIGWKFQLRKSYCPACKNLGGI